MPRMSICKILSLIVLSSTLIFAAACGGDTASHDSGMIPCSSDSDCPLGQFCKDGVCAGLIDGGPDCIFAEDCSPGQQCLNGRCVDGPPDGGEDGADGPDGGDVEPGQPDIEVEPVFLDFGNPRIGQTTSSQVSVHNRGTAPLFIYEVRFENGTSDEFSGEPIGAWNASIEAGSSRALDVHYTPVDGRVDTGALLIVSNDPDQALLRLPVASSFKGASELKLTESPVDEGEDIRSVEFGQVSVGGGAQQTLIISNAGSGDAVLTVEEVRIEPLSDTNFRVEVIPVLPAFLSPYPGACVEDVDCGEELLCSDGLCMNADGHLTNAVAVTVFFEPGRPGPLQANLVITNDEQDSGADGDERLLILPLGGEGIQPAIAVSPDPLGFGDRFVGDQAFLSLSLSNIGGENLHVSSVALEDGSGPFSLDAGGQSSWTLEAGEQVVLSLNYEPQTAGEHADGLLIASDDPEHPSLRIDVAGHAYAPPVIEADPASLEFGEVQLGAESILSVVLSNAGAAELEIQRLQMGTGSSASFSLVQQALPPIPAGESASLQIRYAPGAGVGGENGRVELDCNDPVTPSVAIMLHGIASDPQVQVDPASVDFGAVYHGYRAGPEAIVVRNAGYGGLTVNSVLLGAGSSPDFELENQPAGDRLLQPGESIVVDLYFTPSGEGLKNGTVQVSHNDRDRGDLEIIISGVSSLCPDGFYDIDGLAWNGCEYECTPTGDESCNGLDDDCDGQTDEGLSSRACEISNGHGTCTGEESCAGVQGWVNCDAAVPAQEICNGLDEDCDGLIDADDDSLELPLCALQAGVCAGARHTPDQCDGPTSTFAACGPTQYGAHWLPMGQERCDGLDNDCDGLTDEAEDLILTPCDNQQGACAGAMRTPDLCQNGAWVGCLQANYQAMPDYGLEICDGVDNDCNGLADAADPGLQLSACELTAGVCAGTFHTRNQCLDGSWLVCGAEQYGADWGAEICDGLDNDCDGDTDADDGDMVLALCSEQRGACEGSRHIASQCVDGSWEACSEAEFEAHNPDYDTAETCDGVDNDCNGLTDANDAGLVLTLCAEQDGVCAGSRHRASQCQGGAWQACQAADFGPDYLPGGERCDGLDNNCDNSTDEEEGMVLDLCLEQRGACLNSRHTANQCQGGAWQACGLTQFGVNPDYNVNEICDGVDNDCNGQADASDSGLVLELCDLQAGVCSGAIHKPSQCYNDGSGTRWHACDAGDYGPWYGAEDCDGLDNDCDGSTDEDVAPRACEKENIYGRCTGTQSCNPGVGWNDCSARDPGPEVCDGIDNDCAHGVDQADPGMVLPLCAKQLGVCAGSRHSPEQCNGAPNDFEACGPAEYGANYRTYEICDGLDNDCDGLTDEAEDLILTPCDNQQGVCAGSLHLASQCVNGSWQACDSANFPASYGLEVCDGLDNDCNGLTDAGDPGMALVDCEKQDGVCAGATHRPSLCAGAAGWLTCDYLDYGDDYDTDEFAHELCDGLDNDCDGVTDGNPSDLLTTRPCDIENAWGTCVGASACEGLTGWGSCEGTAAAQEVCDGIDNDCDGATDAEDPSLELANCENQLGVCAGSVHRAIQCVPDGLGSAYWEPCTGLDYGSHSYYYGPEICGNGMDEDCSGAANDRDVDGDGYIAEDCDGTDCDDEDPNTYPGAPEIRDAKDNDCDGLPDEGLIPAGAVVVTEIMKDPDAVLDYAGEWFEVTNVWTHPVNLVGWVVSDNGTDIFTIYAHKVDGGDLVVQPGQSAVLCVNADDSANGGVTCDYDYDNFELGNGDDELILNFASLEIDRVEYLDGSGWPDTRGRSLSLDPSAYNAADNDFGYNWCHVSATYGLGDDGTPGLLNPGCAGGSIAIIYVSPNSGVGAGGETVHIYGSGFTASTMALFDGMACLDLTFASESELICVTPTHAPGWVDVQVSDVGSDTLTSGYRYTGEAVANSIDWCDLHYPAATSTSVGVSTSLIFGQLFIDGVTALAGPPAGITAELGVGPAGSDPRLTPGWLWQVADWNPDCLACGNNDEFMESVVPQTTGTYSYVYRFSDDGGVTYTYCDFDPGTADGFSTSDMGTLTVNP